MEHPPPPLLRITDVGSAQSELRDPAAAAADLAVSPERFINRELSWLDFNVRVLALATDPRFGLLERTKFLAIFASNLDEFFQVRVAGLKDQVAARVTATTADGRTPGEQLAEVRARVDELAHQAERIFLDDLLPSLAAERVVFTSWDELDDADRKQLDEVFEQRIFPVLTPLAVDPGHPFPYISGLSLNLAVVVVDDEAGERRFARVKVPNLLPRFVVLPDGERVVPLEQVIAAHLPSLFPGMDVEAHFAFRVTRNADLTLEEEEADDLLAAVEVEVRRRRFDEQANIEWARELEDAGVHVVYGLVGLKTHTKTTLVVREEADGIRRYCHIGTGNYNPKTARIYEDLGLITADDGVGADLTKLFNYLTGYARDVRYDRLLVAPDHLRPGVLELIRGEGRLGPEGRIVLKMNSLVDAEMIDALYEASQQGTPIDLIIRGICCLRPGVPGLSETIRVRSIVGRYLEHSRIYHLAHGSLDGGPAYLIGSADLMPRNLDRRVEALVPVVDPDLQDRLAEVLAVELADDCLAWHLGADGRWRHDDGPCELDAHQRFQELALDRRRR